LSIRSGIFITTLTAAASPKKMALIGESRVADILANVAVPLLGGNTISRLRVGRPRVFGMNTQSCQHNVE